MVATAIQPLDPSLLRPVARAVSALLQSSPVLDAGADALGRIGSVLEAELRTPATLQARLLEAPVAVDRLPAGACYAVLAFANTGEYALLELEEGLAAALVDRLAGSAGTRFAPGALTHAETAALGFLSLCALRAVREVEPIESAFAVRLSCICRSGAEIEAILALESRWIGIDLALQVDGIAGGCRLLLPGRALRRLCRQHPSPSRELAAPLDGLRLEAPLLARGATLAQGDLARVSVGDAVLLPGLARADEGCRCPVTLAFDTFHLCGQLHGRDFTFASFTDAALAPEVPMSAPAVPPPLPIEVEVELARVRIPLSELGRLQPGAVLGLDMDLTDSVVLRVGSRPFARAELVDIEGEVGARIVSLLA